MAATFKDPGIPPLVALFFDPSLFALPSDQTDNSDRILMARGLRMAWGSGGAMIGWCRCCTHGERGGKSQWEYLGWRRLMLVVVC